MSYLLMTQKQLLLQHLQSALASLKNIYWILGGLPKKNDKFNLSNLKNITKMLYNWKNIFFKNQIKKK